MKRWTGPVLALGVFAAALRLTLYFVFQPVGVEPDGLGLAVLFWSGNDHARLWAAEMLPLIAGYWPPAYPAANALVGAAAGDPFLAGRLVSALFAGVLAGMVALLVRRLTSSRMAGLFAGALAALAPLSVAWDVRVRPEAMFLAAYVAAVYFAVAYGRDRSGRDLVWATALSGVAALVKYDVVCFLPPLAVMWFGHLRRRQLRDLPWGLAALAGWLLALTWMLTHQAARAGDYRDLFSLAMLRQFPVWTGMTLFALPTVATVPVCALAIWGAYSLLANRESRPAGWLLVYLVAAHIGLIAVGYNWTSRYLLMTLPFVAVLAGVGWYALPRLRGLRAIAAALAVTVCLVTAVSWVRAEHDRWRETIEIGRAVAGLPLAGATNPVPPTVWTDDPYLTPYWAGRDLRPLDDLSQVQPNDYVVLHDWFGALRHKRMAEDTLKDLHRLGQYRVVAEATSTTRPLSGEVLDAEALARVASLRELGPWSFSQRGQPLTTRAVLLFRMPETEGQANANP